MEKTPNITNESITTLNMILIIFFVFLIFSFPILFTKYPKPGDIWIYYYNKDNPFLKEVIEYRKVIDVRDGYVRYIRNNKDTLVIGEISFKNDCEFIMK